MRALHLKKIGEIWHYQRRRPVAFADVEPRALIRKSLRTTDFAEAKFKAARITLKLDHDWSCAKARGVSLAAEDCAERYSAALDLNQELGLRTIAAEEISDDELLQRLRLLITGGQQPIEQKAVLGLINEPELNLLQGFERFWAHIREEWSPLADDQKRVKRNIYLKAIRNFEDVVGAIPLYEIQREHALTLRTWFMKRVETEGIKPNTANRELDSLRRLIATNFDIDSIERTNPFSRVRLKDRKKQTRQPFSTGFIREELLAPEALPDLPKDLHLLLRLLVNTGMRPSEGVGLELADFFLDAEVPHVHVRANRTHSLKTDHSERQLPLVGVSLTAAQAIAKQGGWGKWAGKNMYATTLINRHFRETGLVTEKSQSLYSLRHWFQDQLTKRDVVDRAQAQLMGHKFQRPKYGFGKDLAELHEIIDKFAIS